MLDTLLGDLRDMYQSVFTRQNINKGAEVHDLGDLAFVDHPDFNFSRHLLDTAPSLIASRLFNGSDLDDTNVVDFDSRPGLLGDSADGCTTFADDIADLFRVDAEGNQSRCVF